MRGYDASLGRTREAMEGLFQAPPPWASAVGVAVLGLVCAVVLLFPASPARLAWAAVALFVGPGLGAAVVGWAWHRATGGVVYVRRNLLLSLVGAGMQVVVVGLHRGTAPWHDVPVVHAFLVSAAAPLWLRYQVVTAMSNPRPSRSLPDTLSHFGLSLGAAPLVLVVPAGAWTVALATGAVFLGAGATVVEAMRSVGREEFDGDLIEMNWAIIEHITRDGGGGREPLEDLFHAQGIDDEVPVGVVTFHGEDGLKAVLVVPTVHPGPFGTLGGSDLPRRLQEALAPVPVLTFHGACTHDQNPVDQAQVDRVVATVRDLVEDVDPVEGGTSPVRLSEEILAQGLGPGLLAVHAPSPTRWDDVDLATGAHAEEAALNAGARSVLFADAHHCGGPGVTTVHAPSPKSRSIVEATRDAAAKVGEASRHPLRVGVARASGFHLDDGVGPMGVQVLVVEAGDHRTAYVLFDGNNMVPGLRDDLVEAIGDRVDEAEVLTTDNHVVNMGLDGWNPVGYARGASFWTPVVLDLLEEAAGSLAPAACGMGQATVEVRTFGPGTASRMSTLINVSTVAASRLMAATLVGASALGAAVTLLL